MIDEKKVTAKSYTLREEDGTWLGQVILTNDGMFASVTDWGNLSYAWRSYGDDFRDFILKIKPDYFATKMYTGMTYMLRGGSMKSFEKSCQRFAEKILPALQKALRREIELEKTQS